MISTIDSTASTATRRRKALRISKSQQERVDRLLRTELAFIANATFVGQDADYGSEESDFVTRVEESPQAPLEKLSAGLPAHLGRLCATPLLSHEEERDLFRRMNYCKHRANALRNQLVESPELADEIEGCIVKAERIRNYLLQANTRLVLSIARKFADARNLFDDLLSQGIASLMHAVEKFDFDRGYRFSTYATCAVRRDLYRLVMGRKKDLQRFSTGSAEQLDACPDGRAPIEPNAEANWKQLSGAVAEMMSELDDRERLIVSKRFGLQGEGKKQSYSTLGRELGISKERVRQLANRALDKLRESATDRRLEALLA